MIFAGIKLVTGYELRPSSIGHTEGSITMVKRYLKLGEWLFQYACNQAVNSDSFIRVDWKEMSNSFSSNLLGNSMRLMNDFQKSFQESFNFNINDSNKEIGKTTGAKIQEL